MIVHIPMEPMPYKRARRGKGKSVYVPEEYQEWKSEVGLLIRNQMKLEQEQPAQSPGHLTIRLRRDSFQIQLLTWPPHRPKGMRGDLDNYIKAILDAGNGVLYEDDQQVEWINGGFV